MIRKTMRWIAPVVALGLLATVAYAAKYPGVVINPPEKGDYVYWVAQSGPGDEGAKSSEQQFLKRDLPAGEMYLVWPTAFKGDSVEVSDIEIGGPAKPATTLEKGTKPPANAPKEAAPAEAPSVTVGLYDVKGNLAGEKTVKLDPKAAVAVSFDKKDFDHVGNIAVDVGDLKSGVLEMTADGYASVVAVLPPDDGRVAFFFVPIGSVQATLHYDKDKDKSLKFDVDTPEKGEVQTVKLTPKGYEREEQPAHGKKGSGSRRSSSGGGAVSLLRGLFAIVVLAAVVYFAFRWVKTKNVTLDTALHHLGVTDVPPPSAGDPGVAGGAAPPPLVAEGVCEFCGQKKDAQGNCACTLAGGAVMGAGPAAPMGIAAAPSSSVHWDRQ